MRKVCVRDIVDKFGGKLISGNLDMPIENISIDTRKINENNVFFGIKTNRANGSDYLQDALDMGAKVAVVDHCDIKVQYGATVVVVEDVKDVLQKVSSLKHEYNPQIQVIAVTGSVGKTTTKDLISEVLSAKYKVNKTNGNLNNDLGVPITFLQTYDEDISVIEMGMNHIGELDKLSKMVKPNLSIITNIGTSHIGNLGSKDNIFKAKMEILNGMDKINLLVNSDDSYLANLNYNTYTYGIENPKAQLVAKNIISDAKQTSFKFENDGTTYTVKSSLVGNVQVYNILCAIRVAQLFDVPIQEAVEKIENLRSAQRRLNIDITPLGIKVINDTYNASFESMQNALQYLENFTDVPTYAIIGDMLEQGEMSVDLHKQIGMHFKKSKIKNAIFIGNNAKYMYEGAKSSNTKTKLKYFSNKQDSYKYIDDNIKPFDVVLVKASNGMKFDEIVNHIYNMSAKGPDTKFLKRK